MQLRKTFAGTGKVDGKTLSTPGEYDEAYVQKLLNKGVTDEGEVAAAVMARPDGHAAKQGEQYARGIVQKLLQALLAAEAAEREKKEKEAEDSFAWSLRHIDFKVDEVLIQKSDKSNFIFKVEGQSLVFTSEELTTTKAFRAQFIERLHRCPTLPPMKGFSSPHWDALVRGWLVGAKVESLPVSATDHSFRLRLISRAKDGLMSQSLLEALLDGAAYIDEAGGRRYFAADAVFERVRPLDSKLAHRDLAVALLELGCTCVEGFDVGGKKMDVWSEPLPPGPSANASGVQPEPSSSVAATPAADVTEARHE